MYKIRFIKFPFVLFLPFWLFTLYSPTIVFLFDPLFAHICFTLIYNVLYSRDIIFSQFYFRYAYRVRPKLMLNVFLSYTANYMQKHSIIKYMILSVCLIYHYCKVLFIQIMLYVKPDITTGNKRPSGPVSLTWCSELY